MKTLMTGAALALLLSAPAMADMMDWDTNADTQIDEAEFGAGLQGDGVYGRWDADADGMLSEDEFNDGVWSMFDDDDDGIMNEPEGVSLDAMRTGWEADESN